MAKESKLVKNANRQRLVALHAKRRAELVAVIRDGAATAEAKDRAYWRLGKMPRDASATRFRNRCQITGRARGYMRDFGVSRIKFRELALQGMLPGVKKASW
jgi:small subunit ribosomal protein S14